MKSVSAKNLFAFSIACQLFLYSSFALAQFNITGKVVDKENHAIELAEIQLLLRDSTIIKSELSNDKGFFSINSAKGNFQLQVKQLGTVLFKKDIGLLGNLDLGIITVETSRNLNEVVIGVRKKLIERKVDRLVFNVENSISAIGGDAIDALKVTPGLKIKDDAVNMIGKNSAAVMIDDRIIELSGDDLVNYLKTIKSQDIKNIEVITNPPAKYSAEGNSGLINIRLKKAAPDSWNASLNSNYKQATYATGTYGGSFNYQKKKVTFFTNLNYSKGSKKGVETEAIEYDDDTWNSQFNRRIYANVLSGRMGFEYTPNKKASFGAQYLGSFNKPETIEDNNTFITKNNTGNLDSLIRSDVNNRKNVKSNSFNLHTVLKLDSLGKNLSFDADYFSLDNTINRDFQSQNKYADSSPTANGYSSSENYGLQNLRIYSAKIDLSHPLKWINLSYGAKVYFSETDYDNQYYDVSKGYRIFLTDRSNVFNYRENTQAMYVSGKRKVGKIEVQVGLRMENTQTSGNSVTLASINKNHYFQLFPTAYLQFKQNDDNNFSINFGRRLSRPRFNELNPFKVYANPYSYTQGNPYLTPAFSNNVEFQYTYKEVLTSSLSFSNTTDGIGNPPFFDPTTKVTYLMDLNYYTTNIYSFSESYIFDKLPWLESENQVNVYYLNTRLDKNLSLPDVSGFGGYFSTNNSLTMNKSKTLKFELNFWCQTRQYQDIYLMKGMAGLDAGVKVTSLNKRLQLALIAQDILKTDISAATTNSNSIRYGYRDYNDNRFFRISLTYSFGRDNLSIRKRNFGNEEEKRRADN